MRGWQGGCDRERILVGVVRDVGAVRKKAFHRNAVVMDFMGARFHKGGNLDAGLCDPRPEGPRLYTRPESLITGTQRGNYRLAKSYITSRTW